MNFRTLKAEDIECRIGQTAKDLSWVTLLLYKDARCDMAVLDEAVGAENWQREHYECKGNLFCRVGIKCFDEETGLADWVYKSDCGVESNTEAQKGESSDSFKRACVNWGIGRELYTAPLIYIPATDKNGQANYDITQKNGKDVPKANFVVTFMKVRDGKIVGLNIENTKKRATVFAWGDLSED